MTRQVGNEIDEFVIEALRNNLVGLPLDLAALNMARGRDTGIPSLNEARAQFFAMTGDAQLTPYTSWVDFAQHLKHPVSLINFIAAYGTHPTITAATTLDGKRAARPPLVIGAAANGRCAGAAGLPQQHRRLTPACRQPAHDDHSGLNDVDLWIGGLAEKINDFRRHARARPSTSCSRCQLEHLQNGDRFYYLSRTQGMNLLNQLENNTFAKLIMRNTDLGTDTTHLPSLVFTTPNYTLELSAGSRMARCAAFDGIWARPAHPAGRRVVRDTLDPKGDVRCRRPSSRW